MSTGGAEVGLQLALQSSLLPIASPNSGQAVEVQETLETTSTVAPDTELLQAGVTDAFGETLEVTLKRRYKSTAHMDPHDAAQIHLVDVLGPNSLWVNVFVDGEHLGTMVERPYGIISHDEMDACVVANPVYDGWRPSEQQCAAFDLGASISRTILACWVRDNQWGPADWTGALCTTCILWASIKSKMVWVQIPQSIRDRKHQVLLAPFGVQSLRSRGTHPSEGAPQTTEPGWHMLPEGLVTEQPSADAALGWLQLVYEPKEVEAMHEDGDIAVNGSDVPGTAQSGQNVASILLAAEDLPGLVFICLILSD